MTETENRLRFLEQERQILEALRANEANCEDVAFSNGWRAAVDAMIGIVDRAIAHGRTAN